MKKQGDDAVGRALELVLRVSRVAGVAPLSFTSNGLRPSRFLAIYSHLLITAINATVLGGFALDLHTEPARALRVRTPTSKFIWIGNLSIVFLITSVGVYTAPVRIDCMIKCLEEIKRIKVSISKDRKIENTEHSEKHRRIIVILVSAGLWVLIVFDLYGYAKDVFNQGLESTKKTFLMYSIFYYEYFLILLLQFQFVLTALQLHSALGLVNEALCQQLHDLFEGEAKIVSYTANGEIQNAIKTKFSKYFFKPSTPIVPTTALNFVIDSLAVISRRPMDLKDVQATKPQIIRDLSLAYGRICDVLRQIDNGHGLVLLLILTSFLLQLVITPYYLITALYTAGDKISNLLLQVSWCMFHVSSMIMVVEPCHRTQGEMSRTQVLVTWLMRHMTSYTDPIYAELDLFYKQLVLNRPSYEPLGMCTLSRPLAVTIIGSVTTYLVIIFQFRSTESDSLLQF